MKALGPVYSPIWAFCDRDDGGHYGYGDDDYIDCHHAPHDGGDVDDNDPTLLSYLVVL